MLSVDEHVGHGVLARLDLELVLDGSAIALLIKLEGLEGDARVLEELLGADAEGAVALGEDHDLVVCDVGVND